MNFNEKYTTAEKKAEAPEKEEGKMELSNDGYCIGGLLEELINKIEKLRKSAIRK